VQRGDAGGRDVCGSRHRVALQARPRAQRTVQRSTGVVLVALGAGVVLGV